MDEVEIVWTDYMRYRASLRGFDLAAIEQIVRYSVERYIDSATGRMVAVGRDRGGLVMVAYERDREIMTPITVHATTRQQINSRLKSGRFSNE